MGNLLCKDAEHAKQAKQERAENAMLPASEKMNKQEEIHNGADVDSDNPDIPYADEVESEEELQNDHVPKVENQHRNITIEKKNLTEENVVIKPESSVIGIVEMKNEENLKTCKEYSNVTNSETETDHDKSENIPHVDITKDSESELDQKVKSESEPVEDVFGKRENISEAPVPDLSPLVGVKDNQLIPEERELEISDKEMDIEPPAHDNTSEVNIIFNVKVDDDDVSNPLSTIPGEIEVVNTDILTNITEVKATEVDLPETNDERKDVAEVQAHIFLDSDISNTEVNIICNAKVDEDADTSNPLSAIPNEIEVLSNIIEVKATEIDLPEINDERNDVAEENVHIFLDTDISATEVNIICNAKADDDDVSDPLSTIPGEIKVVNTDILSDIIEVKATEIDLPEINDERNDVEVQAHIFLDSDIIGNDDIFLDTDNSIIEKQETKYQVEEDNETNSNLMKNEEHYEVFHGDDITNSIEEPSMEPENSNNNNLNGNEFTKDVEECVETSFVECFDEHIPFQIQTNTDQDNIVKPNFEDKESPAEGNIDEIKEEMVESLDHTKSEDEVEIVEMSENSYENTSIPEKPEADKINLSTDFEESKKIIEEFMKDEKDNLVKEKLQEDLLSDLNVEEKVEENKQDHSVHELDVKDDKTVSDRNNNQNVSDEYFTNVEINIQSVLTNCPLKSDASESDESAISNYVEIEMGITDIKEAEFIKMESDVEKMTENAENQSQNINIDPPPQSP